MHCYIELFFGCLWCVKIFCLTGFMTFLLSKNCENALEKVVLYL